MLLIFVLAFSLRLAGLHEQAPESDELLWVKRSHGVLKQLREEPLKATTHLGHPGVTPALLMAGSQAIGSQINPVEQVKDFENRLFFSRLATAFVTALLGPLVILLATPLFGLFAASLSAFLLICDPRFIGFSRLAHLDATLTVLVTLCIFSYIYAVRSKSVPLKLLSGALWGLCIATKPTSALIVLGFIFYKLARNLLLRNTAQETASSITGNYITGETALISWSDIWAVITGHIVFASIYTRFWLHKSDYRLRLEIRSKAAQALWKTGRYLHNHLEVLTLLILCLAALLFLSSRYITNKKLLKNIKCCLLTVSFLIISLAIFPHIYENFARFWTWVAGLSGESHDSFGKILEPLTFGYVIFFVSELPVLTLLGVVVGLAVLIKRILQGSSSSQKIQPELFLFLFIPIIWITILSVSDKQAWRYALPTLGCIYLFVGWALSQILQERGRSVILTAIFLLYGAMLFKWYPNYITYFNPLSGGAAAAIERGQGFMFSGQRESVEFIKKVRAKKEFLDKPLFITTLGDAQILKVTSTMIDMPPKVHFGYYPFEFADYIIHFDSHPHLVSTASWSHFLKTDTPVFSYTFLGTRLARIHKIPLPKYEAPYYFDIGSTPYRTGRKQGDPIIPSLVVERGISKAGYLAMPIKMRIGPGRYTLTLKGKLLESFENEQEMPILKLMFGKCSKDFFTRDFSESTAISKFQTVQYDCELANFNRRAPEVYWYGKHSFELRGLSLVAKPFVTIQR